jgi:NAD(P)-dependent dehydrogenase (short-subunit alcohol dehydrogenase family)
MNSLLDTALDRSLVLGYSRIGFALRRRGWPGHGHDLPRLDGATVAVTGPTSGLGEATAAGLHQLGARVLLLVRSRERGEQLIERLISGSGPGSADGRDRLVLVDCDLGDLTSVRGCAAGLLDAGERLHALINNAGVMVADRTLSTDGIELTFATDVVGPFLLSNLLEPALAAAGDGTFGDSRLINLSSGGMYGQRIRVDDLQMARDYNGVTAYARSKRAIVILSELWAERWRGAKIGVHSTHPGWADTQGVRDSLPTFRRLTQPILRSATEGADTTVWLTAADAAALGTGGFWHDRVRRPTHYLPSTRESAQDRTELWRQCCELSGWSDDPSTTPDVPANVRSA